MEILAGSVDPGFLRELWDDGEVMRYVGCLQGLGIDERGMLEKNLLWFEEMGFEHQVRALRWCKSQ